MFGAERPAATQPAIEPSLVGARDIGVFPRPPPHVSIRVATRPPLEYRLRCRQGEGGERNQVTLEAPADPPVGGRLEAAIVRAFRSVTLEYVRVRERPTGNHAPEIVFLPYLTQSMRALAADLAGEADLAERFTELPETYRFRRRRPS